MSLCQICVLQIYFPVYDLPIEFVNDFIAFSLCLPVFFFINFYSYFRYVLSYNFEFNLLLFLDSRSLYRWLYTYLLF